jgi:hypothetical protein
MTNKKGNRILKVAGYVCMAPILSQEQIASTKIEMHEKRMHTVESIMSQLQPCVEMFVDDLETVTEELRPFVDSLTVRISEQRYNEFREYMYQVDSDAILVPSFHMLSSRVQDQYELILGARGELPLPPIRGNRILLVSLEQTSLLKLDIDLAFELQEQWVLAPMRKILEENRIKSDDNYTKLRDLMLEKLTVEKIAERLGQSKSTIFRWRKQFEDRLAVDIPGFKIGD